MRDIWSVISTALSFILMTALVFAVIRLAWPLIVGIVVAIVILGVIGYFRIRRMQKMMEDELQQMDQTTDWFSQKEEEDDPFVDDDPHNPYEERVDQPEVIDVEYTERQIDENGK